MKNILGTPVAVGSERRVLFDPNGPNRTVFDDTSIDTLTGSQGQDWYLRTRSVR